MCLFEVCSVDAVLCILQVEAKSNNIAFLTTELHRLKMQARSTMPVPGGGGGGGLGGAAGISGGHVVEPMGGVGVASIVRKSSHVPVPPRDLLTQSGRVRRGTMPVTSTPAIRRVPHTTGASPAGPSVSSKSSAAGLSVEGDILARPLRGSSASTRSQSSGGSQSPDITPFVHRTDIDRLEAKKPLPLPPISSSQALGTIAPTTTSAVSSGIGERNVRIVDGDVRKVLISSKASGAHRRRHARLTTPEVATLAVDQVNSENNKNWNHLPESHSSDYN